MSEEIGLFVVILGLILQVIGVIIFVLSLAFFVADAAEGSRSRAVLLLVFPLSVLVIQLLQGLIISLLASNQNEAETLAYIVYLVKLGLLGTTLVVWLILGIRYWSRISRNVFSAIVSAGLIVLGGVIMHLLMSPKPMT